MKALWSHADDVNYMGPQGGLDVGWHTIGKMWDDTAALRLGGKVEPVDVQLHVSHQIAVVSDIEAGENTNANGETAKVSIRGLGGSADWASGIRTSSPGRTGGGSGAATATRCPLLCH
jgi:hypothetical protein